MDSSEYLKLIGELKHLANTLSENAVICDIEFEHFVELEALAEEYESRQDDERGGIRIPIEVSEEFWHYLALKARRMGMATNDYVASRLIAALCSDEKDGEKCVIRIDKNTEESWPSSLLAAAYSDGISLRLPLSMRKKELELDWKAGDTLTVDYRGEALIVYKRTAALE